MREVSRSYIYIWEEGEANRIFLVFELSGRRVACGYSANRICWREREREREDLYLGRDTAKYEKSANAVYGSPSLIVFLGRGQWFYLEGGLSGCNYLLSGYW